MSRAEVVIEDVKVAEGVKQSEGYFDKHTHPGAKIRQDLGAY